MNNKLLITFLTLLSWLLVTNGIANSPKRVLIGSPIRQKPAILKEFLQSLEELDHQTFQADYFFIDDNTDPESVNILYEFSQKQTTQCFIAKISQKATDLYICNEKTHYWNDNIIWKVAAFKDEIIKFTLEYNYDYLFLVDSDLVLHPKTIDHLISTNKEIVSNIFWTQWQPEIIKLPQVWYYDEYKQYSLAPGEQLAADEINKRQTDFLRLMATPGTYEVGGLGACTLLSKSALTKGANFKKIKNITFWGEDRHFCVRAAALGIDLFVDTHYPSYHIYRESHLSGIPQFKECCRNGTYYI